MANLPKFYGHSNENPFVHLRKLSNQCEALRPTAGSLDRAKLKPFNGHSKAQLKTGFIVFPTAPFIRGLQPRDKERVILKDLIKLEVAMNGFSEVLNWVLFSHRENFTMLNRQDDQKTAVVIANPRSSDFEVGRTSLMPSALKLVAHNKDHPKPIKVLNNFGIPDPCTFLEIDIQYFLEIL